MTKLEQFKRHLRPGQVYRRQELAQWSRAVDRHLKQLVDDGTLTKLAGGLYAYPRQTVFGKAPAEDGTLVGSFLKGDRFLLASPSAYNSLGVGTTQLYNKTVVYNRKRHGEFVLGGRAFDFRVKPDFPKKLTDEFLLVDLVNNVDSLAESRNEVLDRVKQRAPSFDTTRLERAVRSYGNMRTKRFFTEAFKTSMTAPRLKAAGERRPSRERSMSKREVEELVLATTNAPYKRSITAAELSRGLASGKSEPWTVHVATFFTDVKLELILKFAQMHGISKRALASTYRAMKATTGEANPALETVLG